MKKIIVTESQLKKVLSSVIEEQSTTSPQTLQRAKANDPQRKDRPYPKGTRWLTLLNSSPSIKINGKTPKKGMNVLFTDTITGNDGDQVTFYNVPDWGQTIVTFKGGRLTYFVATD